VVVVEVCVESLQDAKIAVEGGCDRLEVCSSLSFGGLTPSIGLVKEIKRNVNVQVFALIRPRPGRFCYSEDEVNVMEADVLAMKESGANGVVIGALDKNGLVDEAIMRRLMNAARPMLVTFHRAIDISANILQTLESCAKLGCERILTSGGMISAEDGTETIKKLVQVAKPFNIIVVAGAGISEKNVRKIIEETKVTEIHGSFRKVIPMPMMVHDMQTANFDAVLRACSAETVKKVKECANSQQFSLS